jgi:hypothetical protein
VTERSGAEVRSDGEDEPAPRETDLGSRTSAPDDEPDTVFVVVAWDMPPGRLMPQAVVREVPRAVQADWDERFWRRMS